MARIRIVEINNFRGIKNLTWYPCDGINCLIGSGDSGKSTILDAIDYCLGARRYIQFTDADFHLLNVNTPITISITLGNLSDGLKNLDTYGLYLRGFNSQLKIVEDEPEKESETVLTVRLTVSNDLEPVWTLVSQRAEEQDLARNLAWNDRIVLAPTRVGVMADYHLGWHRGSVLNRISEERVDASAALIKAARDARSIFGTQAQSQLGETLGIVGATAKELGIMIGDAPKAMLDAHSVSFNGGTVTLHDEAGVPLRGLGVGSTRLLIAGLQRKAATQSSIILIDEMEHGLEPHRIMRLLGSLGAKEPQPPLQVFMTTHSPVALRELADHQLYVMRASDEKHDVKNVAAAGDIQSTIRLYPDAFLASGVMVCEGASEVGLIRGLDLYLAEKGKISSSLFANGVALVDCGGGDPNRLFSRASAFHSLGYRVAVMRDDDKKPDAECEGTFLSNGGTAIAWRDGRALEDELFQSMSIASVEALVKYAIELHGSEVVNSHIKSASQGKIDLSQIKEELSERNITTENRCLLGKAAKTRKSGWFKSVTWMEYVARHIIGPDLKNADQGFKECLALIFIWGGCAGK